MNHGFEQPNLEDRLKAVGSALQARTPLKARILEQIREAIREDTITNGIESTEQESRSRLARRTEKGLRGRLVSGGVAGLLALVAVVIAVTPAPTVGWSQLAKKLQDQKWIRGRWVVQGKRASMWISPAKQLWSFDLGSNLYFYDGVEKSKYEFHPKDSSIIKLPLGENRIEDVLPLDELFKNESSVGSRLFGSEKVVQQERREVIEDGKTWIDFHIVLARGEFNQGVLRVDPDTKLPVYFLFNSSADETKTMRQDFDFPSDGPANIFELGAPRDVQIIDMTPDQDVQRVLAEIAISRARIGDFRLVRGDANARGGSVICRKGDRWRIDQWRPVPAPDGLPIKVLKDGEVGFLEQKLSSAKVWPYLICDGTTVWQSVNNEPGRHSHWEKSSRLAPHDLLSGNSSSLGFDCLSALIFPDLSPKRGWIFEFDPHPLEAPDCVLIKTGAQTGTDPVTIGHDWYYLDPQRGYAVVRTESFSVPNGEPSHPDSSDKRSTFVMEGFEKTIQGFWYPRIVSEADGVRRKDGPQDSPEIKFRPSMYYNFYFEAELPDSLFLINDVD